MKSRSLIALALSFAFCFCAIFSVPGLAGVFTFETQYEYTEADNAWLTDLVIKESMDNISYNVVGCTLVPAPDYPYNATANTFKDEVEQFCELYSLNEGMLKVSYLYFIELLGSNSSVFAAQASDSQVRTYLENAGITYPDSPSTDVNVLAKALYTAMITGAFSGVDPDVMGYGVALEQALTSFVMSVSGFDEGTLREWVPVDGLHTLDDYVMAVSRLTLWSNGYDVTADTDEDTVYRLMAVMTIRNMGVSVDTDASFKDLQAKYVAALLGKKYNVTVDPTRLADAINNGNAAFYVLQLIGQKQGLTVRMDSGTYEEAFLFVASETDIFDIEEDEFYADIYAYDIYLTAPRSSLWIYPTSYYSTISPEAVAITCNGMPLKDNFYTQVPISETEGVQKLTITVNCIAGSGAIKEYVITVHSEDAIENQAANPTVPAATDNSQTILSSNTIVSRILNQAGVDAGVTAAAENLITGLPDSVKNAISFIAPTFEGESGGAAANQGLPSMAQNTQENSKFIGILDSIGASLNSSIGGIDGINLGQIYAAQGFAYNYITIA